MALTRATGKIIGDSNGNLNLSGIVTASSFVGSGSGLTGVASTDNINTSTNAVLSGIVTTGALNVSGNATITGNLGVGGVVTYEDVTNVDSIGIITARSSINVKSASSGIGITLSSGGVNVTGIITANSYRGDGSQLTGITGTTINNNADNRVITGSGSANTLNGESGVVITSDSELIVGMTAGGGATPDARLQVRGDTFAKAQIQVLSTHNDDNPASLQISKSRGSGNTILGDNDDIGQINFAGNDGNGFHNVGRIMVSSSGEGNGNDDLPSVMRFFTTANGGVSLTERMRISSDGYVTKPNTPAFYATHSSGSHGASGSTGYITYNTGGPYYNNGNHFDASNGRFTVPVTGIYHLHFHGFIHNTATQGNVEVVLRKFNSDGGGETTLSRNFDNKVNSNYGPPLSIIWTGPLTATQYVQIYSYDEIHHANGYYFGGYLVG